MSQNSANPKLAIVIHTEEEFDWNGGFHPQNNQVTHGNELISYCNELISVGAKVTLAMDYAFINSPEGNNVIQHFLSEKDNNIEFATHLHPWVSPPIEDELNQISNQHSYPGNLAKHIESEKLKMLTDKIAQLTNSNPITYLAGRYGIGPNTNEILHSLGYKIDISVSPFSDFSHQQGPDFSQFNNQTFVKDNLTHWPHTTAIVSLLPLVTRYFNNNPQRFEHSQKSLVLRIINKLLRVKRQRLSPEGFSLKEMQRLTLSQIALGQTDFILSFHSPSVKSGLTPYVKDKNQLQQFKSNTLEYVRWFTQTLGGKPILVKNNCAIES
ncbi:hypothetical protein QX776_17630 [Alteromonadaceae bacterium BrNp21-10]|nr:hypothetical protein [Alteromonadaceae bacterium BrNp21-10]